MVDAYSTEVMNDSPPGGDGGCRRLDQLEWVKPCCPWPC